MKKLLFFLLFACTALLLSCKTTKASVSATEKSETVATGAYRLCSSLTTDSISQRLTLSVDSMMILFAQPYSQLQSGMSFIIAAQESTSLRDAGAATLDDMYFLGNKPPAAKDGKSVPSGNKQRTAQQPSAISIYGLHIDKGDNKKSIVQSSAKDSMAETTQSYHAEEKNVRKTAPSSAPKYIFYILLIGIAIWIYHKLRS